MIIFLVTVILGTVLWYFYHKLTFWQRQGIPTPKQGLLHQWHHYRRELGPFDQEIVQKLGPMIGLYEGLTPILLLTDPELIRQVLIKDFQNFPNHKPFRFDVPNIDNNLFSLDGGEDWKRIRSIISPTFTSGKLRAMDQHVVDCITNLNKHFAQVAKSGDTINIRHFYNSLAFNVILKCGFSTDVDILSDPKNEVYAGLENSFSGNWATIFALQFPKAATYLGITKKAIKPFEFVEGIAKKVLAERKVTNANLKSDEPVANDFVQLMLNTRIKAETGKYLSDEEVVAQAMIFLLAGYETTSTILSCSVYHLATNPTVQDKLIAEVSGLKDLTVDTVGELKYLDAVLKESFRLSPPVIRVQRQCTVPTQLGKVLVQPGTIVEIPVFALHRDPTQYTNPNVFDPSRFMEGGKDVNHHPQAFMPFGSGPRLCIAQRFALMEAKMALAMVLQTYRFVSTRETKMNYEPASLQLLAPLKIMLKVVAHG